MEIIDPISYAAPLLAGVLIVEFAYSKLKNHKTVYNLKDLKTSLFLGAGSAILSPVVKFVVSGVILFVIFEFCNPEIKGVRMNMIGYKTFDWAWFIWILCLLFSDLTHYWFHRLNHTVRIMWAAHRVHHSSEHYNFGTAVRLSWVAMIYKPLFYAWLPAIGFQPEMILSCMGVEVVWQFLLHTSYCPKLKILDYLFITPKQHEVHHATNLEYLDKNHGAIFNIWDRLFGTWKDYDEAIDIQYGVLHSSGSYNILVITLHEYKAIWKDLKNSKTLNEAFMYVFGPPGWHPQGHTFTVKQMQSTKFNLNSYNHGINY